MFFLADPREERMDRPRAYRFQTIWQPFARSEKSSQLLQLCCSWTFIL
jgi:hypothetical protein